MEQFQEQLISLVHSSYMRAADCPEMMALARNIRRFREQLGMSQSELARQSGINRGYILLIEGGKANPSLAKLCRLSLVLSVSVVELISPAET